LFIKFSPKNIQELKIDSLKKINSKNKLFLAIEFKKKHIGNILIDNINYLKETCEIGILIGNKNFRNKTIGTKILQNITKRIFAQKKINQIYMGVHEKNIAALKCYVKVGFRFFKKKRGGLLLVLKNNIFNKLILGTAQFGKPYGISNQNKKKVSITVQKKIFNLCKKIGINEIDTAESYNFDINLLPKNYIWIVNTKFEIGRFSSERQIETYLESFKKRNIILNCLYIHGEKDLFTKKGNFLFNILYKLKKKFLFNKIGISLYNLDSLKIIIKNFKIDTIQVSFNILDKKITKYEKFLKKKKIEVHARSIFLQGLLLMKKKHIPDNLSKINPYIFKIRKVCKLNNVNLINYLLNYVDKNNYIQRIIFGVHSVSHLYKIASYENIPKISYNKFNAFKEDFINPSSWTK
jgi:aryl-alcohol dehydrogenase-like predicted oxidoreductase